MTRCIQEIYKRNHFEVIIMSLNLATPWYQTTMHNHFLIFIRTGINDVAISD